MTPLRLASVFVAFLLLSFTANEAPLVAQEPVSNVSSIAEPEPTTLFDRFVRVVSLQDYNTRVVLLGTLLLGVSGGIVGTFMLLRRRTLVGDVVGHASLPGIAVAFLVMEMIRPGMGKTLSGLMFGAFLSGLLGAVCTLGIRRMTRLKDDAALAIVLSIFFGIGVSLFTVVQKIPSGNVAGLHQFVFGKTSSLLADDVKLFGVLAAVVIAASALLFKELSVLCFDEEFARTEGWPVFFLDSLLMGLIVSVTIIGLQSVGLLLVVALPIIPAASARFWTDNINRMAVYAGLIGGISAVVGVVVSAMFPRLATGPVIVLSGTMGFLISLLFGTQRGIVQRWYRHRQLQRRIGEHDLLRACYEYLERDLPAGMNLRGAQMQQRTLTVHALLPARSWSEARVRQLLERGVRTGLLQREGDAAYRLTNEGSAAAVRAARNHRLWELFLIRYADIAPSHVDRDADLIEHVIGEKVAEELETALGAQYPHMRVPDSPHEIGSVSGR